MPFGALKLGTFEVHHITGTDNGTFTGIGGEVTITCSGVSCIFALGVGTNLGTLVGGETATLSGSATVPWKEGDSSKFVCTGFSGTGTWTAEYEVTPPKPLYVESS